MSWLLDAYVDARTYRVLSYLLLALPLGIVGFVVVVTSLTLGAGLAITVVGIPILVVALLAVRGFARVDGELASSLLGAQISRRHLGHEVSGGLWWEGLRRLVSDRRTWVEMTYVLLRLPLGILDFVVATSILGIALGGFAQPILVASGVESEMGSWTIDTFFESLFYLPFSIFFLLVGPRLLLGWGTVSERVATAMLGYVDSREMTWAVSEVLARTGETDAFRILDEVQTRMGRGPSLTITRVEAALLVLQTKGRIRARRIDSRTLYSAA